MTGDEKAIEQLEELYAQLPTVECKGLCWNSCGPIDMSYVERRRLLAAGADIPKFSHEAHVRWASDEPLYCPALTKDKRCSVYEIRPLICRLWGVARGTLGCRHGCRVSSTRLRAVQAYRFIIQSYQIGGWDVDWSDMPDAVWDDPAVASLLTRIVHESYPADEEFIDAVLDARDRLLRQSS